MKKNKKWIDFDINRADWNYVLIFTFILSLIGLVYCIMVRPQYPMLLLFVYMGTVPLVSLIVCFIPIRKVVMNLHDAEVVSPRFKKMNNSYQIRLAALKYFNESVEGKFIKKSGQVDQYTAVSIYYVNQIEYYQNLLAQIDSRIKKPYLVVKDKLYVVGDSVTVKNPKFEEGECPFTEYLIATVQDDFTLKSGAYTFSVEDIFDIKKTQDVKN